MKKNIEVSFSSMSEEQLLRFLRERYEECGIESLSYPSIKKVKGLYYQLYKNGISIKSVISKFGLKEEYETYKLENFIKVKGGEVQSRWSWERVIKEASYVVEKEGFLPPAQWFQKNKMGSLVYSVYNFNKNWNDLREYFDSYENSNFIESRNGMRWLSHAEASFSNFLYARGIEHRKGQKYPEEYNNYSGKSYGYFDVHFRTQDGSWADVEIWGDKPNGHNEEGYAEVRQSKESFNIKNPYFIGIEHGDCYEESKLEVCLEPFIGRIAPFVFDEPFDKVLPSTHWSNADELISYCREIAKQQPDGVFPTEEWLRKRGKYKDRDGEAYNTVSIYIKKWIGGIRQLRELLGQDQYSTISWDRKSALDEYLKFYEKHGLTAGQVKRNASQLGISEDDRKLASNITIATAKYVGSIDDVHAVLNINPSVNSKWNREKILSYISDFHEKYGLVPSQIAKISPDDKKLFGVSKSDIDISKQLVDSVSRHFSGIKEVYEILKIEKTDVRRLRKMR